MSNALQTVYYTKKLAKQPVLDFLIKQNDFYINTHGVSVSDITRSYTSRANGLFYVLNKENKPIYFNRITPVSVRFRNESAIPANRLSFVFLKTELNSDETMIFDSYNVKFRSKIIGTFTISRPVKYTNGNNEILTPFQSIEFAATYTVNNVNMLDTQYYGASNINPNRKVGTIDINLNIRCYSDKELTNIITDTLTLTVNLVNTGYVPQALNQDTIGF